MRTLVLLVLLVAIFVAGPLLVDERVVSYGDMLPMGAFQTRATRTRIDPELAIDRRAETMWSGTNRKPGSEKPPRRKPGDKRPAKSWGIQGLLIPSSQWGVVFDEPITLTGLLIDRGEFPHEWTVPSVLALNRSFDLGAPLDPVGAEVVFGSWLRYEFEPVEVDGLVLRPRYRQKDRWALRNVRFQVAGPTPPTWEWPDGWPAEAGGALGVALVWALFLTVGGRRRRPALSRRRP